MPADPEWYAGISGEPVGPVDVAFLKKRIDEGAVTGETLVWREELTDWKPLSTFSELARLLPGAPIGKVSDPIALTRATEEAARASVREARDAAQVREAQAREAQAREAQAREAQARAGEQERKRELAEARAGEQAARNAEAERAREIVDAKAAAASATEKLEAASVGTQESTASASTAPASPMPGPVSIAPDSDELRAAGIPAGADRRGKGRGLHPMAYALVAMATAFGGVAAWFIFGKKATPVVAQIETQPGMGKANSRLAGSVKKAVAGSDQPASPKGSAIALKDGNGAPRDPGQWSGGKSTGNGISPKPDGTGGAAKLPPAPTPCTDPDDPFCNSGGPEGPRNTAGSDGQTGSGSPLTPSQVNSTVGKYSGSLKRRCRAMVTKGNAKVSASIRVSPSGSVSSVAVSGGSNVPGLAGCVRSRISNWRFPTAGASTTVNVSYNFL